MGKQVNLRIEIWKKLTKAKYDLGLPTISDVIDRLFKISKKIKNAKGGEPNDDTNANGRTTKRKIVGRDG